MIVAVPVGLGQRHLPVRVRPAEGAQRAQAHPRGAGRASRAWSSGFFALVGDRARRSCSASPAPGSSACMAAGIGVGHPVHPARRVGVGGRPALACPWRSARRATAWAPRRSPPSPGSCVPAAVSGLVAAFILAVSRAIGETMVVFIAGGRRPATSASSSARSKPGLTMTAAMATAGPGHRPGGGRGAHLPEPLLRRCGAVPHHAAPQPHRRPLRAPGPAGLLMAPPPSASAAEYAARRRSATSSPAASAIDCRSDLPAPAAGSRSASRSVVLAILFYDVLHRRASACSPTGPSRSSRAASAPTADASGVFQAIKGTFWIGVFVVVLVVPDRGRRRRSTSRSTPPRAGSRRLIDVNIRNLAGVPSIVYGILGPDHLRPGAGERSPAAAR